MIRWEVGMHYVMNLFKMLYLVPVRLCSKVSPCAFVKNSFIHKTAAICFGSRVYNCKIGRYSYIGRNTTLCKTNLGSFCSIADHCIINPGRHPEHMVSTSPVFYAKKNILHKTFHEVEFEEYDSVDIGNDVWIGTHAFIKGGVKIGNGAIIGAYSVVTKDVEAYAIVAGNPAKLIRKRFEDTQITMLQNSAWWNLSDQELLKISSYFSDVEQFQNRWVPR